MGDGKQRVCRLIVDQQPAVPDGRRVRQQVAGVQPDHRMSFDLDVEHTADQVHTQITGQFEPLLQVLAGFDAVLQDFERVRRLHQQGAAHRGVGPVGHRDGASFTGPDNRQLGRRGGQQRARQHAERLGESIGRHHRGRAHAMFDLAEEWLADARTPRQLPHR